MYRAVVILKGDLIMSNADKNERSAIVNMTSRMRSSGYIRAKKAGIPVTYMKKSAIVCVHNGNCVVVAKIKSSGNRTTPKMYLLK